jgi:glucose dehydrogenase
MSSIQLLRAANDENPVIADEPKFLSQSRNMPDSIHYDNEKLVTMGPTGNFYPDSYNTQNMEGLLFHHTRTPSLMNTDAHYV